MVVPLFGWSAGDIVATVQILYHVGRALRESGGASEKYQKTAAWVAAFAQTLEGVKELQSSTTSHSPNLDRLAAQVSLIDPIYEQFETGLRQRFGPALSSQRSVSSLKVTFKKIQWTVKDLHGHVSGFKTAVDEHMTTIVVILNLLNREEFGKKCDFLTSKISDLPNSASLVPLFSRFHTFEDHLKQIDPRLNDLQASIDSQTHQQTLFENGLHSRIEQTRVSAVQTQERLSAEVVTAIRSSNRDLLRGIDGFITQVESRQLNQDVHTEALVRDLVKCLDECVAANKSLVRSLKSAEGEAKIVGNGRSTRPILVMPLGKNPDFTGREKILDDIGAAFTARHKVAIVGPGGVGKSEIAAAHCYRQQEKEGLLSIFWVHGDTVAAFIASYQKIAAQINLGTGQSSDLVTMDLVVRTLTSQDFGKWLMVIDNVDDYAIFREVPRMEAQAVPDSTESLPKPLRSYIPSDSPNGRILFTSRSRSAGHQLAERVIVVPCLTAEESQALFRRKLEDEAPNDHTIQVLGEELEHLPLAITQACATIKIGRPAVEYLARLQGDEGSRINLLRTSLDDVRRREGRPYEQSPNDSVIHTWITSFDQIHSVVGSKAVELVCFICHFHQHSVPIALIKQAFGDSESTDQDLMTLCDYEFITRRTDSASFDMHRFTQLTAWAWLEQEGMLENSQRMALAIITKMLDVGYTKTDRDTCKILAPHAEEIRRRRFTPDDQVQLGLLYLYLGLHLKATGNFGRAAETLAIASEILKSEDYNEDYERLLAGVARVDALGQLGRHDVAEEVLLPIIGEIYEEMGKEGKHLPESLVLMDAWCKTLLGKLMWVKGSWNEAQQLLQEACDTRAANLAPDNKDVLSAQMLLAAVLHSQGEDAQVVEITREVLHHYTQLYSKDHEMVLYCHHSLGLALFGLERHDAAEDAFRTALTGRAVLLPDHPFTMLSEHSLTTVRYQLGKITALQALEEVQDQFIRATECLKDIHPTTILIRHSRAVLFRESGQERRAIRELDKVIEKRTELLGEGHPDTLATISELAVTYYRLDKHAKAKQLAQRMTEKYRSRLGPDHERTVSASSFLALFTAKDDPFKAERLALQLLDWCRDHFGPDDKRSQIASVGLSLVYRDIDRPKLAVNLLQDLISQEKSGPSPTQALKTQALLAKTHEETGDHDAAEKCYSELVDSYKSYYGSSNPRLYSYNQARILQIHMAGRQIEAESMMRDLIEKKRTILGPVHPEVYASMSELALILSDQGKYEAAERITREALAGRRQQISYTDRSVYQSLNNLALVLCERENFDGAVKHIHDAFNGYNKELGPDHTDTLLAMHNVARIYSCKKDWEKASVACVKALEGREAAFGPQDTRVLATLRLQLDILFLSGSYKTIVRMRSNVLERHESKFEPEHQFTLVVLRLTGSAYFQLDSLVEAEADLRRAFYGLLKLRKDLVRRRKISYPWKMAYFKLLNIYKSQQRFQDLESLTRATMDIEQEAYGPDSSQMGFLHRALGLALQKQKKVGEAVDEYETSLTILEKTELETHANYKLAINPYTSALYEESNLRPQSLALLIKWRTFSLDAGNEETFEVVMSIARCLFHLNHPEAEQTYKDAIELAERLYGIDGARVWEAKGELGCTYNLFGRYTEAADLLELVSMAQARQLGAENITTVKSTSDFYMAKLYSGGAAEAEHKMRWVLVKRQEIEGDAPGGQLIAQSHLGVILRIRGELDESIEKLRAVLKARDNGVANEDTLRAKYWLAWTLMEKGKLEEAERLAGEAVKGRIAITRLGRTHRETLEARSLEARIRLLMYKTHASEEVEEEFREIVAQRTKALGEQHPFNFRDMSCLALTMAMQGKIAAARVEAARSVDGLTTTGNTNHPFAHEAWEILARLDAILGRMDTAETSYRHSIEGVRNISSSSGHHVKLRGVVGRFVLFLVRRWLKAYRGGFP